MAPTLTGPDFYTLRLGAHAGAVPLARHRLAVQLEHWRVPQLIDDAALVASELITNVERLGAAFTLMLWIRPQSLVIAVRDRSTAEPRINLDPYGDIDDGDADNVGGAGLLIVSSIAEEWGWSECPGGKLVWARLSRTARSCHDGHRDHHRSRSSSIATGGDTRNTTTLSSLSSSTKAVHDESPVPQNVPRRADRRPGGDDTARRSGDRRA